MDRQKILVVGLYDNCLTLLVKLLLKTRKESIKYVRSVGVSDHAHNELRPPKSVMNIALDLGFIITFHNPPNPVLTAEAENQSLAVIYHQPRHISSITNFQLFDLIITPYQSVYDKLLGMRDVDSTRVVLVCSPAGINIKTSPTDAFPLLKRWVEENF